LVFGIGTCAVAVCLVHRQRAWSRIALAGLGIAALSTSPYALRAPVLELFGDRYLYIPALGFSMALAGGLAATPFEQETPVPDETGTRSPWPARATTSRTVHAALLSLWGATLAHGTLERCRVWRDEATLFGASVARDPENFYALLMLGLDAAAGGRVAEARALLDRSLAANPLSWRTWNAHCVVAMRAGELTTAEASCLRSLELQPENPGTWTNLAAVSMRRGAFDAVVRAAREGLRLKPKQAGLGALLAGALANLGRVDEALAALAAAERVDAAHPDVARLRAQFEARQIVPPEGEASRTLSSPFE
jgi:cytochrome c-type biogenesis protein CcmH/NrfG